MYNTQQVPVMQNRLAQMENQYQNMYGYPYSMQQNPYQSTVPNSQQIPAGLKGRPVGNIEEARASMIDLDGSIFVFPDYGNGRIYTKQINLDGTSSLRSYKLEEHPAQAIPSNQNQSEWEPVAKTLQEEINSLKSQIQALTQNKEVKSNVQSNANVKSSK